jgi:hypothetical protein
MDLVLIPENLKQNCHDLKDSYLFFNVLTEVSPVVPLLAYSTLNWWHSLLNNRENNTDSFGKSL